jgi:hypothetical protein
MKSGPIAVPAELNPSPPECSPLHVPNRVKEIRLPVRLSARGKMQEEQISHRGCFGQVIVG